MIRRTAIAVSLVMTLVGGAAAQTARTSQVVVFPFQVHSRENLGYLKRDLARMLSRQLAAEGIKVISPARAAGALGRRAPSLDAVRRAGAKIGADFAVFGSVTKIGARVSLDVKVLDTRARGRSSSVYVEGVGLENIRKFVAQLARAVAARVVGRARIVMIEVQGNKRIEAAAVKNVIGSREGGPFSRRQLNEDLKKLHKMGYFSKVHIRAVAMAGGRKIIITVVEKPTIREVEFKGNRIISTSDLKKVVTIKRFSVVNPGLISENINRLLAYYKQKGYYNAVVRSRIEPVTRDQVKLIFDVQEGKKVYIRKIRFIGNKKVSRGRLLGLMSTSEKGWLSWFTDSGILNRAKLAKDAEAIASYYYNHGFIEAKVSEPVVTRKGNDLFVIIRIHEGPQYRIGKLDVIGDLIQARTVLLRKIKSRPGMYFNRQVLRGDLKTLTGIYQNKGYAFVEIDPAITRDTTRRRVNIIFRITKKRLVYIERIIITGNTRTIDKVIRRELGLVETGLFRANKLRQGTLKLHKLKYFSNINITTPKGTRPDRINVRVDVREKRTGALSFGAGYSTSDLALIMGQISQTNLFGRGLRLSLRGILAVKAARFMLSFTQPWLFDRPISAGFDLYNYEQYYSNFDLQAMGLVLRVSFPLWGEYTRMGINYKYDDATVKNVQSIASTVVKDMAGNHTTSSIKFSLVRDSRDKRFLTTRGSHNFVTLEYAGGPLGGTNYFTRINAGSAWYFPLIGSTVGVIRGRIGYVTENAGGRLPLYEKYYLGGIDSLRAWAWREVAPRDPATGDRIGGEYMALINIEYRFPLIKKVGLQGVIFLDVGNVWAKAQGYDFGDVRYDAGGGIRWYSPVGPFRLEWGYNLDQRTGERSSNWNFSVGASF
ncbi:MAG: outer membrane protein assembly factor BamA [Proteobacteria bacterium]|nr:outer membrane protein assembly factor BamA [Pseudomonadota bacterium]MBU1741784.1 outer membrane protein assembly factor BamA [Pseudomonadota bacterium]